MNEDLLNVMGSFSEISLDCLEKQNEEIEQLEKENKELMQRLVEQELWLRACVIELMKNAEKDYYWIMNHQIENSKNITIGYSMAGNGDIQFYQVKEDNKEE